MKNFLYLIVFLFSTFFLFGCGDEENGDGRPQQLPATSSTGASTGAAGTGADETDETNSLIEEYNRQRAQLIEKYNQILKPNAPLPVSTKQTVCTKGDQSINLEVNEYIEDITIPGNGNDLLCDFLIDGNIDKFATVEGEYCTKEANKKIDKLKVEGYTCPNLQQQ